MPSPTLAAYMTPAPYTIGEEQTLATAHAIMRTHRVRHLPVLRAGKLVGIVSERDLLFVESLPGVDTERVLVEEAMTERPVALSPATSLEWVAAEMAQLKLGSVVVVENDRVVGVFTCVDALRALQKMLGSARRRSQRPRKSRRAS
jgi:acetoin utilization protein AcuB